MFVVIAGCGRVGSRLASDFAAEGHNVVVVDQNAAAFRQLGSGFNGLTVQGNALDEDVLRSAGALQADALAAVTSRDSVNLMAAQIARDIFHVPKVAVRVSEPGRAAVVNEFGLRSVCAADLAAVQVRLMLLTDGVYPRTFFGRGEVVEAEVPIGPGSEGLLIRDLEESGHLRVAAVVRAGEGILPTPEYRTAAGDVLVVTMAAGALRAVRDQFESDKRVRNR